MGVKSESRAWWRGVLGVYYCIANVGVHASHSFLDRPDLAGQFRWPYAVAVRWWLGLGFSRGSTETLQCQGLPPSPHLPGLLLSTQPLHVVSPARWLPKAHTSQAFLQAQNWHSGRGRLQDAETKRHDLWAPSQRLASHHRGTLWKLGKVHGERPVVDELPDLREDPGPGPEPSRAITQ